MTKFAIGMVAVLLAVNSAATEGALVGPVGPGPSLPGGPTTFVGSGAGSNQAGGKTFAYSGIDLTQYSQLYDAVNTGAVSITSPFDHSQTTLTLTSGLGTNAITFKGTTRYGGPTNTQDYQMPVEFILTASAGLTWQAGLVPSTDAAIDLESQLSGPSPTYSLNQQWLGDPTVTGTYVPLGPINNTSGIGTSFSNSFYYAAVPEPTTLSLAAIGGVGLLARRRRRSSRR